MNVVAPSFDLDLSHTMFLVVDDKQHFRDIAHNALTRCRVRDVKYAPDVDEAVQVLKRFGPNIGGIVCDWDMSPVSGLELLRRVRAGKVARVARELCVVILTQQPDTAAVKSAMLMDVSGFAVAPLSIEKFVKTLAQALQRECKLRAPEHYLAVPGAAPQRENADKAASPGVVRTATNSGPRAAAPTASSAAKLSDLINVRMCTLSEAQAGSILARDLFDRDGHLLLKSGAPLSQSLLGRLNDVSGGHGESYHVWVGEKRAS